MSFEIRPRRYLLNIVSVFIVYIATAQGPLVFNMQINMLDHMIIL